MRTIPLSRWIALALVGLSLSLVAATQHQPAAFTPLAEVQGQSFSIARNDPLTATGVHPADILGIGGAPLILCENLGLACTDGGAIDDIIGLSYGWDFVPMELPPLQFSVDGATQGAANTAVRTEAACAPAEPQGDAFETALNRTNLQDLDGNGAACGGNAGFGLGLTEGASADNVDALERDPCQFVDGDCDGVPEEPIFLTLAPGSPTLALLGARPADILMTAGVMGVQLWADGVTSLGLAAGDVIDGLCVREDGDAAFGAGDQVLFSLAPGSPTLQRLGASPADLLRPAPPRVGITAALLGLRAADNVDALVCTREMTFRTQYLPVISNQPR